MDTAIEDQMAPEASPGALSTKSGVRRVNNVPVYIVVGALAIFLLIMVLVASDRAAQQKRPGRSDDNEKGGSTTMFAKEIAGDQKDGIIQAKAATTQVVPALPEAPVSIAIARPNLDLPPLPPGVSVPPPSEQLVSQQQMLAQQARAAHEDEATRIRMMKLQQFDEAVKARTSLPVANTRGAVAGEEAALSNAQKMPPNRDEAIARLTAVRQQIESSAGDDPTAAYKARLQLIQSHIGGAPAAAAAEAPKLVQPAPGRNDLAQFAGTGQGDRWRL